MAVNIIKQGICAYLWRVWTQMIQLIYGIKQIEY